MIDGCFFIAVLALSLFKAWGLSNSRRVQLATDSSTLTCWIRGIEEKESCIHGELKWLFGGLGDTSLALTPGLVQRRHLC